MAKTIKTKILLRNDLAANWTSNNPILGKGQMGVEIDTKKFKFGDGVKHWNELGYGAGADIANASASSDGLMSSSDFSKLAGIEAGAEANIIQKIQKNGTDLTITNKTVNITVPTKTSDITNDSGFITIADIPEGAAASTTTPKMDGTAAVGTELAFARGDHVHPSDTTKVDKVTGKGLSTNDYTTTEKNKLAGITAGAEVNQNAFSAVKVGTGDDDPTATATTSTDTLAITGSGLITVSRPGAKRIDIATSAEENQNAFSVIRAGATTDETLTYVQATGKTDMLTLRVGSGLTLTPYPSSKTLVLTTSAQANQNAFSKVTYGETTIEADTTEDTLTLDKSGLITLTLDATNDKLTIGTTATANSPYTSTPAMDGTASAGSADNYSRGDHVHPTDTSRAPLASPTFTGTPKAPTATSATNDTQIATTAFVHSVVSDAIDDVTQFDYEVVTNLPTTGTKGKIYLVAHTHGDRDIYDEYIWVGSTYEKIGNTDIDLTNYLQSVTVAGQTLTPSSNEVTAAQIKSAMSLGAAADKAVDTTIPSTPGTNLPTSAAVATYVSNNSTKVTSSSTNGNIKINNVETTVYTLPSTVVDSSDTLILDCGNSTTNYS